MNLEASAGSAAEHVAPEGVAVAGSGDPSAGVRLQILATEHWSLLATRSMTWNESFSRVSMFLSILTGSVVALALAAQATTFAEVTVFAVPLLAVVLFVGVATVVRLNGINNEDITWVAGLNRIRHAYLELQPDLARYFITGSTDDMRGITLTFGMNLPVATSLRPSLASIGHGFVTIPGMLTVIVSVVAGALAAVIAVSLGADKGPAVALALVAFLGTLAALARYTYGSITGQVRKLRPQFPTPEPKPEAAPASE